MQTDGFANLHWVFIFDVPSQEASMHTSPKYGYADRYAKSQPNNFQYDPSKTAWYPIYYI
jgi:hypothetical protein